MSNGVNIISEGVFEIDGKKKLFMNLRKKIIRFSLNRHDIRLILFGKTIFKI